MLAFSDLQADLAAELVRRGIDRRHVQPAQRRRDPADDPDARRPGRLSARGRSAGRSPRGRTSIAFANRRRAFPARLRVFFEEWDDPLISGIRWVEELVEIAGGAPIFPELGRGGARAGSHRRSGRRSRGAIRRSIFASWCGKKVKKATIRSRPGWDAVSAVRDDRIFEMKSTYILQPGPASLTEGVRQLHDDPARNPRTPAKALALPMRRVTGAGMRNSSAVPEG